jgi:YidC/Oxa1 family membrane protein insertase
MILGSVLGPFEDLLAAVLEWIHTTIGLPWAWSIVALTIIVRALLLPLSVRQIHSMQHLQAHAPEMKAIQQRWKNDKARQREELMKFYAENKINPAASCLPIVFQIPIFIALFFVLRGFEDEIFPEYRRQGENLSDLEWLNLVSIIEPTRDGWGPLLIVIYVVSQITSFLLSATTLQPAQKALFIILPFVFIPFVINFDAGLMIYWLTTNLWTAGQGIVTRRLMPRPAPPPKRSSRTPPKEATPAARSDAAGDGTTSTAPARQGPPRRVKRKKGGGGRRR